MGVRIGSHLFLNDLHSVSGSASVQLPSPFLADAPHAAPGTASATGAHGMNRRLPGKGEAWLCPRWAVGLGLFLELAGPVFLILVPPGTVLT